MIAALLLLAAAPAQSKAAPATPRATPGAAVQGPVEKLHERVVEAIRNCPKAAAGEIVVCAKDRGVAEAYRLPRLDPRFDRDRDRRVGEALAGAGAAGAGSCTATGAAGATGCGLRDYRAWGADKKERRADGQWYPW